MLTEGEADYLVQLVSTHPSQSSKPRNPCTSHGACTNSQYMACEPLLWIQVCSHMQAKPHMLKSEVVDNETGKSQPSECVSLCLQLG